MQIVRSAWSSGVVGERNLREAVGEEIPEGKFALLRLQVIRIGHELIFVKGARIAESGKSLTRKWQALVNRLGSGKQIIAVGQPQVQKPQRNRVNIGSIVQDCRASILPPLSRKQPA